MIGVRWVVGAAVAASLWPALTLAQAPAPDGKQGPASAAPATPPAGASSGSGNTEAGKAEASKPDVATLLFSGSQWAKAPAGTVLTYDYSKKSAVKELGAPFEDKVVQRLEKGDSKDSRTVDVKMFSGANARPAGPFNDTEQNPVLLLVLEQNVQEMSHAFKANPRYLKNAIRKAWRDKPTIQQTSFTVDGKTVSGTSIAVQPFVGDVEADKMLGLDALSYTVKVSPDTPGYIAEVEIATPPGNKAQFNETLRLGTAKLP